jgi:hypothetical protein
MAANQRLTPDQFKQKCSALGGRVYQEDDRLVCETTVANQQLKFVQYPDGFVSFELPSPLEKVIKQFYTG